ncbi:E3 SUMO-protein ligase ZBED1-like [Neoarius graeffei]|uniref:E3 SUMO-protein ligase ZBED1-like n=1 Tax=Neoarius graeffei TaxID=443677 RepID=UPI00298C6C4E|nr:E3 SUMO-protein ligase ZBED1-like [Neoarius graeffei]
MKTATLAISEEASPTMSMVAPLQSQLLSQMRCTAEDSSVIKELKTAVHNNLNSRYEALKDNLCVASSLDPRFKTLPFLSDEARDAVFLKLTSEAVHLDQSTDHAEETTPEQEDTSHGDIVTAQRSCLTPQHVDQLLFLQKNYTVPED